MKRYGQYPLQFQQFGGAAFGLPYGTATPNTGGGVPYIVKSQVVVEQGSGIGGAGQWRPSNAGTQTITFDPTVIGPSGRPSMKIDASVLSPTGGYFRTFRHALVEATALTGAVEMWVWVPATTAGGISIVPRISSDVPADPPVATPANNLALTFSPDKMQQGYWTNLFWHPDGRLYAGFSATAVAPQLTGTIDRSFIRQFEFDLSINTATPANERYIYVDVVAFNGKSKPKIFLGFDGFGDASHEAIVKPKFDALGMAGYIAGDGDSLPGNIAKLLSFQSSGWDILQQGRGHKDYTLFPDDLSPDYDLTRSEMIAEGLNGALEYFSFPFNRRNLANDAVLRSKGVKMARTTGGNRYPATSIGKPEPLVFGALDMGQKTGAQMLAWVDDAILTGYAMGIYGHTVAPTASSSTITATAEFNYLMDGLDERRSVIEVTTPSRQPALWSV